MFPLSFCLNRDFIKIFKIIRIIIFAFFAKSFAFFAVKNKSV